MRTPACISHAKDVTHWSWQVVQYSDQVGTYDRASWFRTLQTLTSLFQPWDSTAIPLDIITFLSAWVNTYDYVCGFRVCRIKCIPGFPVTLGTKEGICRTKAWKCNPMWDWCILSLGEFFHTYFINKYWGTGKSNSLAGHIFIMPHLGPTDSVSKYHTKRQLSEYLTPIFHGFYLWPLNWWHFH